MLFRKIGTAAIGLALAVSVPASAAMAATRPGSAVPAAASLATASSSAQSGQGSAMTPWPAYAVIALTVALGVWIATKNDDKDSAISRG